MFLRVCVHVRLFVCLRVVQLYDIYAHIITYLYPRTAAHRRLGPRELRYTLGARAWCVCLCARPRAQVPDGPLGAVVPGGAGRCSRKPFLRPPVPSTLPCVLSRALPWARVCSCVLSCVSVCVRVRVHVCAGAGAHMHCGCMRVHACVRARACVRACVRRTRGAPIVSRVSLLSCGCAAHAHDVDHRADEQRRVRWPLQPP